jgi:Domain of unknown function (DUF222)
VATLRNPPQPAAADRSPVDRRRRNPPPIGGILLGQHHPIPDPGGARLPGEAATRIRAATAVGPRSSSLGEKLEPQLPRLAALQRDGVVSPEKVAIVEQAMHKLSRPGLSPENIDQAEQLLTDHAAILAPPELRRFAHAVVNAANPDGPEPIDDQLQHDRRYLELKQRRDGMWHLAVDSATPSVPN